MTIAMVGDIHGNFKRLRYLAQQVPTDYPMIQVGDFGFWPQLRDFYTDPDRPVYFIDGNHDHVKALHGQPMFDNPVEIWPNAIYVPRGKVLDIGGHRILFLGGAASVDRHYRSKDDSRVNCWFEEEIITEDDKQRALRSAGTGAPVTLMITHTPPQWMIDKYFGPPLAFGHSADWRDSSAQIVEDVWKTLDCPPLFCGHMHQSIEDGVCRILGIDEVYLYDNGE